MNHKAFIKHLFLPATDPIQDNCYKPRNLIKGSPMFGDQQWEIRAGVFPDAIAKGQEHASVSPTSALNNSGTTSWMNG